MLISLLLQSCSVLAAAFLARGYEVVIPKCDRPGPEPIVVSFEGGIGCGKSTQIELLVLMKDILGVANVSSWPEPSGAFSEMGRFWPLAQQVDALRSHNRTVPEQLQHSINEVTLSVQAAVRGSYTDRRLKAMAWACEAKQWGRPLVLLERTTGTQSHVFAPLLVQEGYLTEDSLKKAESQLPADPTPDFWIFYKLGLEQVFERIRKRHRQGENAINEYMITNLNRFTWSYFDFLVASHGASSVHQVDASGDIESVLESSTQVIWQILHGREPREAEQRKISAKARLVAAGASQLATSTAETLATAFFIWRYQCVLCGLFTISLLGVAAFKISRLAVEPASNDDSYILYGEEAAASTA